MADTLVDYTGAGATAVLVGAPRVSYPFLRGQIPDTSTRIIERDYIQLAASYSPTLAVPPPTDAAQNPTADFSDASAYLIAESSPSPTNLAKLARFTRTYARIPGTQYDPASRLFDRPVMHDIKSGSTYAVSFDDGRTSTLFASRKPTSTLTGLTASTKTVAGSNPFVVPAPSIVTWGSHLVTIKGTGQISFFTSATASAIGLACETGTGLTVAVVKTPTEINIKVLTGTLDWLETSDANIDLEGSDTTNIVIRRRQNAGYTAGTETVAVTETYNVPTAVRSVPCTSHGGTAGDRVVLWNGDKIVALSIVVAAAGNSFTIPIADLPGTDVVVTHCQFAKNGTRYVNGAVDCTARIVSRFYLPGVTVGVSNLADVPNFTPVVDPVSWLATVIAYAAAPSEDTYAVIETNAVESWLTGPIVMKQVTEVQLSDVLKTVDAAA